MRRARASVAALLLSAAFAAPLAAQTIQMEELGAAQAFDAGALLGSEAGLDAALWQGTSAVMATRLINAAPLHSEDPLVTAMLRAALLSAGVPPEGENMAYDAARIRAVIALNDKAALETLLARNPVLAQSPEIQLETALAEGNRNAVCAVSDGVTEGRAQPQWARLRAVCHLLRDERAAADVTVNLLRSTGYENPEFYAVFRAAFAGTSVPEARKTEDSLTVFLRAQNEKSPKIDPKNPANAPALRIKAVWENLIDFSADDLNVIFSDLAYNSADPVGSSQFTYEIARANSGPQGTAQLYTLARSGNVRAFSALLARAGNPRNIGALSELASGFSANDQVSADLVFFANRAAETGDVPALQSLFGAIGNKATKSRIALAADALGGGFYANPLGKDIDAGLAAKTPRAHRDALIGMALGASLSPEAQAGLAGASISAVGRRIPAGDLWVLQETAARGSRAETLLRAAALLEGETLAADDLARVLLALREAGLTQYGGPFAARDFLSAL